MAIRGQHDEVHRRTLARAQRGIIVGVLDETELIGGIEERDIVIVAYDPLWPARFADERRWIVDALGPTARRVDHVGSTSVPGLAAKPIIDIDLSVPDVDDEPTYLPALERAGYHLRVRQSGHRMVRTADLDVHVHICGEGSEWERRHLPFREWLRLDDTDREAYAGTARPPGGSHGQVDTRLWDLTETAQVSI